MAIDNFFRARQDVMIEMHHPLAVLATRAPWTDVESSLAPRLAQVEPSKDRPLWTPPRTWPALASARPAAQAPKPCPFG
jgi:hypothetical protein